MYNAQCLIAGYQFNFGKYKRVILRLGAGAAYSLGYIYTDEPAFKAIIGFHFKKYVQKKDE